MYRTKRLLALLIASLIPLSAAAETLIDPSSVTTATANYKTAEVETGSFVKTGTTSATEYYPHTYQIKCETPNAKFVEYKVARGDYVEAGDVLAVFSVETSDVSLTSMQLELTRAESAFEEGKTAREKAINEARSNSTVSSDPYERQLAAIQTQKLALQYEQYCYKQEYAIANLRESIDEELKNRANTELIAPVSGEISDLNYKKQGDATYVGETLMVISEHDVMLLIVKGNAGILRYNMPVTVETGRPKQRTTLTGRVVAADDVIPESARLGYAFIALDEYDAENVDIRNISVTSEVIRVDEVMLLPRSATTLYGGKYYVTKLAGDMVQRRYVNYGVTNYTDVWILQGLSDGDVVILD